MTTTAQALEALNHLWATALSPDEDAATLRQHIESTAAEIARLQAECEALRKDATRLDWLDKDGGVHTFKIGRNWYARNAYGMPHHKAPSLRAAIDAATSTSNQKDTTK